MACAPAFHCTIKRYAHTTLKPELHSHASARYCDRVVLLPEWRVCFSLYYKRNGNMIGGEFLCERDKSRNG